MPRSRMVNNMRTNVPIAFERGAVRLSKNGVTISFCSAAFAIEFCAEFICRLIATRMGMGMFQ